VALAAVADVGPEVSVVAGLAPVLEEGAVEQPATSRAAQVRTMQILVPRGIENMASTSSICRGLPDAGFDRGDGDGRLRRETS
jgi:hypothetical protein